MNDADFAKMSIEEIEDYAHGLARTSRQAQIDRIKCMAYINASGRWKESPGYEKDSSFEIYMRDVHELKRSEYHNRLTLIKNDYTEDILRYGFPVLVEGLKIIGANNYLKQAVEEIHELEKGRKNGVVLRSTITRVWEKYRLHPKAKRTDWKKEYDKLNRKYQALSERLESEKQARVKAEDDLYALKKRLGMVSSKKDKDTEPTATV